MTSEAADATVYTIRATLESMLDDIEQFDGALHTMRDHVRARLAVLNRLDDPSFCDEVRHADKIMREPRGAPDAPGYLNRKLAEFLPQ